MAGIEAGPSNLRSTLSEKKRKAFALSLRDWYQLHARSLPWRESSDPWPIWVSEIMLQQTQVATVLAYFERFLKRFPTLRSVAEAPLEDVLQAWSGLGYYRRARMLHAAAQQVESKFAGTFPSTLKDALSLPGIGRYTAGAILSIAYNRPHPVLDGNVIRVLSRLNAYGKNTAQPKVKEELWDLADGWVTYAYQVGVSPSVWNQALMELGALICTPFSPSCRDCPLTSFCTASIEGEAEAYPVLPKRPRLKKIQYLSVIPTDAKGRVLLLRRTGGSLLPDRLWEFPHLEIVRESLSEGENLFRSHCGFRFELDPQSLRCVEHSIMNYRIQMNAVRGKLHGVDPDFWKNTSAGRWNSASLLTRSPESKPSYRQKASYLEAAWFTPRRLAAAEKSSLTRKLIDAFRAPMLPLS